MQPDVLVVGLGPAGACAARAAAAAGWRVLALDRKQHAGLPVQCAEFVPAMLNPLSSDSADPIGAARYQRIVAMQTFVEDERPDCKDNFPGNMIDRAEFDRQLVGEALRAGADCRMDTTVTTLTADGSAALSSGETVRATIIIGADGPRSRVGAAIGSRNSELVFARQVVVPLRRAHDATDIFLSAEFRGGYGWLFPRGATANVGLGVEPAARYRLKSLLDELHRELVVAGRVGADILAHTGGVIPVGGMLDPVGSLRERVVLLCGDAAGLTNPVTGAGIASAVISGTLAGDSAAEWLAGNRNAPAEYQEELADLLGHALARALKRRRDLLACYAGGDGPSRHDLRAGWIAYPEYWAA